jgi:hypothetical protein
LKRTAKRTTNVSALESSAWVRAVSAPYLRGYRARSERSAGLSGYWFHSPRARGEAGFFVGFRASAGSIAFPPLAGDAPHCLVFAFVQPRTALHRRLVRANGSLFRWTSEYIRWLTHRPPRFVFSEDCLPALMRSQSMADWPAEKREHFSHNFFVETLAWLVRSGLVRRLNQKPGK